MFIIYGKPNCTWCDQAKALLDGEFIFKDVLESETHRNEFLEEFPGAKTVPKIVRIDDEGNVVDKWQSYEELYLYITKLR